MYIVTGGAGFIGSAMVWKLNEMGIEDIVVVDNLSTSEKWKNLVNRRYVDYVHRDTFMDMVLHGDLPWLRAGLDDGRYAESAVGHRRCHRARCARGLPFPYHRRATLLPAVVASDQSAGRSFLRP